MIYIGTPNEHAAVAEPDMGNRPDRSTRRQLSDRVPANTPYDFAGYAKLSADRLDRLTLPEERTSNLCNRLDDQHSNLGFQGSWKPRLPLCLGVPIEALKAFSVFSPNN